MAATRFRAVRVYPLLRLVTMRPRVTNLDVSEIPTPRFR